MEVRNYDDRLVCKYENKTNSIVIEQKGCRTVIRMNPNGEPTIENSRIKDKP